MDEKEKHLLFINSKPQFQIEIDFGYLIFNEEEIRRLERWGSWFQGLTDGELTPFTAAQRHFVQAMQIVGLINTKDEWLWHKYLTQKSIRRVLPPLPVPPGAIPPPVKGSLPLPAEALSPPPRA